jgi:hypothetical protein
MSPAQSLIFNYSHRTGHRERRSRMKHNHLFLTGMKTWVHTMGFSVIMGVFLMGFSIGLNHGKHGFFFVGFL